MVVQQLFPKQEAMDNVRWFIQCMHGMKILTIVVFFAEDGAAGLFASHAWRVGARAVARVGHLDNSSRVGCVMKIMLSRSLAGGRSPKKKQSAFLFLFIT